MNSDSEGAGASEISAAGCSAHLSWRDRKSLDVTESEQAKLDRCHDD